MVVAERSTRQVLRFDQRDEQLLRLALVLDGEPDAADVSVVDVVVVVHVQNLVETRVDGAERVRATWRSTRELR